MKYALTRAEEIVDLPAYVWRSKSVSTDVECRERSLNFAGGIGLIKTGVAITGNGATTISLATITGAVILKKIVMDISAVTNATTFSNVKFILTDGTNTVDLTNVVDGSGTIVGSLFAKTDLASEALTYAKGDQIRLVETTFNKPFTESAINAKAGVTNTLKLSFTGDADTNITANINLRWTPIGESSTMVVV